LVKQETVNRPEALTAVRSKVPTDKGLKPLVPQHVEVRSYLRGAITVLKFIPHGRP